MMRTALMKTPTWSIWSILVICLLLLQSCAVAPKSIVRHDPLIGKIVNTRTADPIEFKDLITAVKDYDIIYLSEKHDNPEHHHIQQRIILGLLEKQKKPFIAFEFFAMNDTPLLLNFMDSAKASHSPKMEKQIETFLRRRLGWENQGDPMWKYYFDLLVLARANQLMTAGIDLSDSQKKRLTRYGYDHLTAIEKQELGEIDTHDPVYQNYMHDRFKAVHCGMDNRAMQSRLFDTWTARNHKMAQSLSRIHVGYDTGPIVVIIGGGHTEYRLGIMDRVKKINPGIQQVNIGLSEISISPSALHEYLTPLSLEGYAPVPPCDYIWFTRRVSDEDPCKEFKKILEKMKSGK